MLLPRGARRCRRGAAAPSGRLLPATVQAVIAARIDQLSPAARELVRRASIFPQGRVRPRRAVADRRSSRGAAGRGRGRGAADPRRGSPGRVAVPLRRAPRCGLRLARQARTPAAAPARGQQARPSAEQTDRYPRTIAFHLEQAAQAALDLNPSDRTLAERAVEALAHAGDIARRRDRVAVGRRPVRARARDGRARRVGGAMREAWILSVLGEARYWLGEFDAAEHGPAHGRSRSPASRAIASARTPRGSWPTSRSRSAATPTRPRRMFERSLEAARALGDPVVLARTLLMAGLGARIWRERPATAPRRCSARRSTSRTVGPSAPDAWAEVRALVEPASITSGPATRTKRCALARGRRSRSAAERARRSRRRPRGDGRLALRRLLRLDEALEHAEAAIRTFRELGARWELASALGDRGVDPPPGRQPRGRGGRPARGFRLCRELKERALVTWTAAELARIQVAARRPCAAVADAGGSVVAAGGGRAELLDARCSWPRRCSRSPREDRDTALAGALAGSSPEAGPGGAGTRMPRRSGGRRGSSATMRRVATGVVAEARDRSNAPLEQALREPELIARSRPAPDRVPGPRSDRRRHGHRGKERRSARADGCIGEGEGSRQAHATCRLSLVPDSGRHDET